MMKPWENESLWIQTPPGKDLGVDWDGGYHTLR